MDNTITTAGGPGSAENVRTWVSALAGRGSLKIECDMCDAYKNGVVLEDTMKSLKGLTYLY